MRPQTQPFLIRQDEHEILGKAVDVTLDGLIQTFGLHTVEGGKVSIEHHPLPAYLQYPVFYGIDARGSGWYNHAIHLSLRLIIAVFSGCKDTNFF